jgi:outer membrane protein assembly factor BamB
VLSPLTAAPPAMTYTPLASASDTGLSRGARGFRPPLIWEYRADSRLDVPPYLSLRKPDNPGYMMLASSKGTVYGSAKAQRALIYSYQVDPVSAFPAQYGDLIYIPYSNSTLVAMNLESGQLLWRQAIGGVSRRKPEATDEDVFLMPERSGLYRVSRATGQVVWQNAKAERFLSANQQMVYALDGRSQLLVLDRARGTQLSSYDGRDFTVPIVNDFTDRVFLGAHDGLLICLYDRHYPTPAWNKQLLEEKPEPRKRPGEPAEGKEKAKEAEK